MVMRNTRVRTPRRRKTWAQFNETTVLGSGTSTPKAIDMLGAYYSDLGAGQQGGLTVMRIVGDIRLTQWTGSVASTPDYEEIRIGVAWLDRLVADAGDGDAQIPEALQDGIRETNWIQQWKLGGLEAGTGPIVGFPLEPVVEEISFKQVDVTQQRKQPNAGSRLTMVVSGGSGYEVNTVAFQAELSILLALP